MASGSNADLCFDACKPSNDQCDDMNSGEIWCGEDQGGLGGSRVAEEQQTKSNNLSFKTSMKPAAESGGNRV